MALFPSFEDARFAAAAYYARTYQLDGSEGEPEEGWRARSRFNQAFVELLVAGRAMYVWTGLTPEATREVRAATPSPSVTKADAPRSAPFSRRSSSFGLVHSNLDAGIGSRRTGARMRALVL